jgi:hypothetical protein
MSLDKYKLRDSEQDLESLSKTNVMKKGASLRKRPSSMTRVVAGDDQIDIIANSEGSSESRITVQGKNGITIRGNAGFSANYWEVKYGAFFSMNPLAFVIPSTTVTPMPMMMFNPPVKAVSDLAFSLSTLLSVGI